MWICTNRFGIVKPYCLRTGSDRFHLKEAIWGLISFLKAKVPLVFSWQLGWPLQCWLYPQTRSLCVPAVFPGGEQINEKHFCKTGRKLYQKYLLLKWFFYSSILNQFQQLHKNTKGQRRPFQPQESQNAMQLQDAFLKTQTCEHYKKTELFCKWKIDRQFCHLQTCTTNEVKVLGLRLVSEEKLCCKL